MENAAHQIAEYILDRRKGGIECSEEGAMYRLFHEVNSLVTMADAHADSERRAKEFLRDMISDISHQLKTPIAALNIYNGILQQETADAATVREFTSLSEQELDRIESLVQSLLKWHSWMRALSHWSGRQRMFSICWSISRGSIPSVRNRRERKLYWRGMSRRSSPVTGFG